MAAGVWGCGLGVQGSGASNALSLDLPLPQGRACSLGADLLPTCNLNPKP